MVETNSPATMVRRVQQNIREGIEACLPQKRIKNVSKQT